VRSARQCVAYRPKLGQTLLEPLAVVLVIAVRPEPSAFTRQTFAVIFRLGASVPSSLREESKTTFVPSGDHRGSALLGPTAVPTTAMTVARKAYGSRWGARCPGVSF